MVADTHLWSFENPWGSLPEEHLRKQIIFETFGADLWMFGLDLLESRFDGRRYRPPHFFWIHLAMSHVAPTLVRL